MALKSQLIVALIQALVGLLFTSSTDAEAIKTKKAALGKTLADMESHTDPGFIQVVREFAHALVAATPPSKEDVRSAATIGDIVIPEPVENKAETVVDQNQGGTKPTQTEGGEGGSNAPPAPAPPAPTFKEGDQGTNPNP